LNYLTLDNIRERLQQTGNLLTDALHHERYVLPAPLNFELKPLQLQTNLELRHRSPLNGVTCGWEKLVLPEKTRKANPEPMAANVSAVADVPRASQA
jgi:hypothetical protein